MQGKQFKAGFRTRILAKSLKSMKLNRLLRHKKKTQRTILISKN